MKPTPKFSIAIVGGGIGGVTLAVALSKYANVHFDLYQTSESFGDIGAGVTISGRSAYALQDLGLVEALDTVCTPPSLFANTIHYRKADIRPIGKDFARRHLLNLRGSGNYTRSQLHSVLVSSLPEMIQKDRVHFKKRLVRYTSAPSGHTFGIKSVVRQTMFAVAATQEDNAIEKARIMKHTKPRWSGMVCYRGFVSADDVEAILGEPHRCIKARVMYCGDQRHLIIYPVNMGQRISVSAYVSKNVIPEHKALAATVQKSDRTWPTDRSWADIVSKDEMLEYFEGFEDQAIALLKCVKNPSRWAIHEIDPLPFYAHGTVALIGDAAHATQPHIGQGANGSIEDAYTLALVLASAHATMKTIPEALKAYELARMSRANEVISLSSTLGKIMQYMHEEYRQLDEMKAYIEGNWVHRMSTGNPKEDVEAALNAVFQEGCAA